jgi:hypothetical protein
MSIKESVKYVVSKCLVFAAVSLATQVLVNVLIMAFKQAHSLFSIDQAIFCTVWGLIYILFYKEVSMKKIIWVSALLSAGWVLINLARLHWN